MTAIALFNNKGGVGKTSLVYHLAWMFADLGVSTIAADLDPQANLTAMFLDDDRLEQLWPEDRHPETVLGALDPILRGTGDISDPHVEDIDSNLGLLVGDIGLSRFEAKLSEAWPNCLGRDEAAFRIESAFSRLLRRASAQRTAHIVLIDVGPNLGAINRSALIAADFVVVPLASDLFSLQGLRNLGPTLREWRSDWQDRLQRRPMDPTLELPRGEMTPAGYVVVPHRTRLDRPVKAYEKWMARIPAVYRDSVLGEAGRANSPPINDPNRIALMKHYGSLMPMAQDARKPMFHLRAADGALGGHQSAVLSCYADFKLLAESIAERCGLTVP